ncbi:MAG: DUF2283 domain-containing protein [Pseudomonadales bacterium]
MKVKYFRDTDTALLEFRDAPVSQTREINEDICIDLDADGNLVSITIEHAERNSRLPSVVVEEIGRNIA